VFINEHIGINFGIFKKISKLKWVLMNEDVNLNKIITLLPSSTQGEWLPLFERVELKMGQVLSDPGLTLSHLYFPVTSIISWVHFSDNASSSDIALIGNEGVAGLYLLMGDGQTHNRAVVQKSGTALRINLNVVLEACSQDSAVQSLFFEFTKTLVNQMAQSMVCQESHSFEQQLCRLLLLTLERQESDAIAMTPQLMTQLLGGRRKGMTQAAHRLMRERILSYEQEQVLVLDRKSLENRSCEC
jgi:CRP-like cAMP-binding protein